LIVDAWQRALNSGRRTWSAARRQEQNRVKKVSRIERLIVEPPARLVPGKRPTNLDKPSMFARTTKFSDFGELGTSLSAASQEPSEDE
jgi:hypothetical protein